MRKLLTALLVLILALPCAAFAEVEPGLVQFDFGDFTMDIYEDMSYDDDYDKISGQPYFYLYQDYDPNAAFTKNLNIVWLSDSFDVHSIDPSAYAQQVLDGSVSALNQQNIAVSNPSVLYADYANQDGKTAITIIFSMTMDYTSAGVDLVMDQYTLQGMCSDPAFGTYYFTITTDNLEDTRPLMEVMDSVDWAD